MTRKIKACAQQSKAKGREEWIKCHQIEFIQLKSIMIIQPYVGVQLYKHSHFLHHTEQKRLVEGW